MNVGIKANCPFCSSTERILKENKYAFVLLSDPRKVLGHFLVIPKRHVEKPWELALEELVGIFELIGLVQKKLVEKLAEGVDVRQNYRPFLKQGRLKIDHVHYHVIPRDLEDKLYDIVEKYETELFEALTDQERNTASELLS